MTLDKKDKLSWSKPSIMERCSIRAADGTLRLGDGFRQEKSKRNTWEEGLDRFGKTRMKKRGMRWWRGWYLLMKM